MTPMLDGRSACWLTGMLCVVAWGLGCTSEQSTGARMSDAESHRSMREALEIVGRHMAEHNVYLGESYLRVARAAVAADSRTAPAADRWRKVFHLANLELNHGQEEEAIGHFVAAQSLLEAIENEVPKEEVDRFLFDMGVAYLRRGETQNCCQRNTPDSCIIPIEGEGIHVLREGSMEATRLFQRVLDRTDSADPIHMAARWLLNVAHMTLGEYPQGVPTQYVIPPQSLASEQSFPRFRNIAAREGVDTFSLAGGAVADDFNNDGKTDLVVSSWDPMERVRVFFRRGDQFEESGVQAGLEGITGGLNMIQADYNNDGFVDVYVLRGGWLEGLGRHPNSLLRNNGDETFTDVTYAALGNVHYPTQTAAWCDFDRDGDLDLYVGNESSSKLDAPCQLFLNDGNGAFVDHAQRAGVTNDRFTKGVACGDYDGDGWPDIYVSNYHGPNRLYRNLGDGSFVDVATELKVAEPIDSFPVWFWDYDNDADLDLFVGAYAGGVAEIAAAYLGQPFDRENTLARLYRNNGQGGFENVAAASNLTRPHHPMGANFGDLDNDGWLDFYLGTGWPEYRELMPNAAYRNDDGRRFVDISTAGGFAHLQKGHAVVIADLDDDGDQDVFEQMGGFVPGDRYHDVLFENPGTPHASLVVKLVGTKSNVSAIGARIRVRVGEGGLARDIYRWVGSGGSFGGNPLAQHIGLGNASAIELLEVTWPIDGTARRYDDVPINASIEIVEGRHSIRVTGRRRGAGDNARG